MSKFDHPILTPHAYLEMVSGIFLDKGDPIRAEKQRAYMRNQFDYCGLTAPQWLGLLKTIFHEHGTFEGKQMKEFINLCFQQEYRELQYVGLEMMQVRINEWPSSWISVLEKYITTESWWETVDWMAKLVGIHFRHYPELQHPYAHKWIESDNLWLQRVAIIHQLLWREKTDEKLLYAMIKRRAGSKEIFIQKACGWALRQYAKTNPASVEKFISKNKLSKLSVREVMKQLNRE